MAMAIDLWSNAESSSSLGMMSPRISFSYDLCQTDRVLGAEHQRSDSLLLESNNFDFCNSKSFEQDSSSCAEDLFSDGKILPQEIKKQVLPPKPPTPHRSSSVDISMKETVKEIIDKAQDKPSSSKSWFKRSSSCGNGYTRSLICSLPLLSRSNSTGSTPTAPKHKDNQSKHMSKSSTMMNDNTKSSSSSSSSYPYSTPLKPSQKKNYGPYNNGVRISPVLNVPPPYITNGTVNFFGLGSLFCNGKDKEKNKKKRADFSYSF